MTEDVRGIDTERVQHRDQVRRDRVGIHRSGYGLAIAVTSQIRRQHPVVALERGTKGREYGPGPVDAMQDQDGNTVPTLLDGKRERSRGLEFGHGLVTLRRGE